MLQTLKYLLHIYDLFMLNSYLYKWHDFRIIVLATIQFKKT